MKLVLHVTYLAGFFLYLVHKCDKNISFILYFASFKQTDGANVVHAVVLKENECDKEPDIQPERRNIEVQHDSQIFLLFSNTL